LYQQVRTERAIEALRDLTSPRALVVREGQPQRIAGRDVVLGDLLQLEEGDRVPADAWLLQGLGLLALVLGLVSALWSEGIKQARRMRAVLPELRPAHRGRSC
jgi:hypothetical protein